MTLGANQIAAYAADLLDVEEQIEALQDSKRDLYASIRDEHGKADALSLKRAVKLSRMDPEKRDEAEAIDTEAQRMLDIIERAARAPRATREVSANSVPDHSSDLRNMVEAADQSTAALTEVHHGRRPDEAAPPMPESASPRIAMPVGIAGTQAPPVDTLSDAAKNALRLRPHCQAALRDDITKCAGHGKVTCFDCSKAHADAEGEAA